MMATGFSNTTSSDTPTDLPAGRPLRTVPVDCSWGISRGDHILYLINDNEEYRPMYRSALVDSVSEKSISVIVYTPQGVQQLTQEFLLFKSLQKVDYTSNALPRESAVRNARQRLDENHYHALYNNSHHFVTKAKTGLEYSLADLIHAIQEPWNGDFELKPVLMKSSMESIKDIEPADHIMDDSDHHWLVESVNIAASSFTGFTCKGQRVSITKVLWKDDLFKIQYPQCNMETSTILQKARTELENKVKWKESVRFVTNVKWGKSFAINKASLLDSNCAPVSCTRVTPHIVLDRGDHLMVKTDSGYCSVLIEAILDANTVVCMPDLDGVKTRNAVVISEREAYRVNYKQHLPPDEVLARAESTEGQRLLQSCQHDSSRFVSWAVTGRSLSVKAEELIEKQELKLVRPVSYKRVTAESCLEIKPGDYLFVDYPHRYRWHFMVTEVCAEPNVFKTVYFLRGAVKETVETVDPAKSNVYKILYAEEFSPDVAIERARSRVGDMKVSMWARLEFVRWAKTGSDEGIEIDLMTNCSAPTSKSSIASFQQLNPGDYLIVEEDKATPFHHCLVMEVTSPEYCTVMEVWYRMVTQTVIWLNSRKKYNYYRLNYDTSAGVCRPAKESISLARVLEKSSFLSKYDRQIFVNYLKTGEDLQKVDVNSLQDDRILLPRKKVESARQLKRGDHIERPLKKIGKMTGCCHHMLVLKPLDVRCCEVVHNRKGQGIRRERVNIFEEGKVSRVKYAERIDPDEGIAQLLQLADSGSHLGQKMKMNQDYGLLTNNCEHVVMNGTIGESVSIQVDIVLYQCLHHVHAMPPGLSDACMRATSKGVIKTVAKVTGTAIIRGVTRAAARGGGSAATQVGTDLAESSLNIALVNSFRIGYTAALSATAIGLVGGIALGANVIIESPLLVRNLYKIHRKKKFDAISSTEAKRQYTVETITSVNTVAGGVGGAIIGQVAIPVPVLGAAVGGFVGVLAGKGIGYLGGRAAAALLINDDKETDLPVIIHCVYVPMSD